MWYTAERKNTQSLSENLHYKKVKSGEVVLLLLHNLQWSVHNEAMKAECGMFSLHEIHVTCNSNFDIISDISRKCIL